MESPRSKTNRRSIGSNARLESELEKQHRGGTKRGRNNYAPDIFSVLTMPNHMRLVARELCSIMGEKEEDFAGEAVVEHISVLLDNPARIGGEVRCKLGRLYKHAFPPLQ